MKPRVVSRWADVGRCGPFRAVLGWSRESIQSL